MPTATSTIATAKVTIISISVKPFWFFIGSSIAVSVFACIPEMIDCALLLTSGHFLGCRGIYSSMPELFYPLVFSASTGASS